MKTKLIQCENCKAKTTHKLARVVEITTRYRTRVTKYYKCTLCANSKTITHEKENKNVQIWD